MNYLVIFEANKPMLTDPDKIYLGQVLRIPNSDELLYYIRYKKNQQIQFAGFCFIIVLNLYKSFNTTSKAS